jgi:S-(hydroxymethyl)glutathione dehydrogenase/alcohol dehydrogenase
VSWLKAGDHVFPLATPECRNGKYRRSKKTYLCQAIRSIQGTGLMPDGSSRFPIGGKPMLHCRGTSRFAHPIVVPGIALAKVRPDAPFDKICCIGCGVTTGVGARLFAAKVDAGANVVVFGLGGIGLNGIQGAKRAGADKFIGVDLSPAREAMARKFGMRHFINPKEHANVVDAIVQLTDGGADDRFECIGNTPSDARRAGVRPQGLGPQHHRWRGRGRRRDQHLAVSTGDRPQVSGLSLWWCPWPHRPAPDR